MNFDSGNDWNLKIHPGRENLYRLAIGSVRLFSLSPVFFLLERTRQAPQKGFIVLYPFKGVMKRLRVDTLSELCSPFLKGGNSTFIAAIASGLSPQTEHQSLK